MRDVGFAPLEVFPRSGKAKGSDARVRIRKQAMLEGCKVSNPHFKWGFIWNPSGVLY